jgi:DNA-directed RNA polymerase specialized sigma24 family protein
MDELNQELLTQINLACSHPPTSPEHRKALNTLFRIVLKSGRVKRDISELYEEALSETMMFVSQQLCQKYDPSRGNFLAWFKTCLYNKYKDKIRSERRSSGQIYRGEFDLLAVAAAKIDAGLLLGTWDSFTEWIEEDQDGVLSHCHIAGNPQASCQSLARLRVLAGKEWQEIAEEVGVSRSTITAHWCRKCQPLLQEWLDQNQRLFGENFHEQ